ncbi:FAD-dependent oxidoreductase [Crossiella cryophila]|uniref:NADPH-dependent 2,4-dienoyl-CoA reductase/sulfur reductase-like enzyme n=1 Tax=Crossiella cryophila TaxID=43355 RepID=A0A7W7CGF9_9PSEU|nr:FAD-dependent oxidoreductase [Crossiella cryophila]MBB4680772.1 NADPH-dependent 2,4-dienoyl-CoA reductase/sulfur reductase-like enzyme [Crossiella cryophila]
MRKRERVVVVGGGVAGLRTAERLRELGFNDEIVLVGAEPTPPYHRPPLSKQLLCGKLRPSDLLLPSYTELDATWRLNTPVLGMDPRRQVVHLPGGEELRYDGLVIATGVEPRHLPGVPVHDPRVHFLHTVDEALALRQNLQRTRRPLVVLGAGFIGCELASTAHHLGGEVTIIGRSKVLLGKAVGPQLAERITDLHSGNGVSLELGEKVLHWLPQQQGIVLNLSSGKVLVAGAVVVCAGSVPAVNWLRGSGLTIDDGVVCEPTCHVLGRGDIVAAGDVARWPNLRFDARPRRVEHWLNAIEMGRHAAESLLAGRAAAKPFTPIPRFWSEQHGMRIQGAGIPALGEDTVQLLPSSRTDQSVTGFVSGGRLVGLVALNSPQALLSWTAELDRQTRPRLHAPDRESVATITPARPPSARGRVPGPVTPPPFPAPNLRPAPNSPAPNSPAANGPAANAGARNGTAPNGPAPANGTPLRGVPVPAAARDGRVSAAASSWPGNGIPGPLPASPAPPRPIDRNSGPLPAPAPVPRRSGPPSVPLPAPPRPIPRMDPKPPTRQWSFTEPAELDAPANGISRQIPRRRRTG